MSSAKKLRSISKIGIVVFIIVKIIIGLFLIGFAYDLNMYLDYAIEPIQEYGKLIVTALYSCGGATIVLGTILSLAIWRAFGTLAEIGMNTIKEQQIEEVSTEQ